MPISGWQSAGVRPPSVCAVRFKAAGGLPISTSMMPSRDLHAFFDEPPRIPGADGTPVPGCSALDALLAMIGACAPDAHAHARRVALASTAMARTMDLPASMIEQVEQAALMHDIGKLAIIKESRAAEHARDDLQTVLLRQHVHVGFDVLSVVPSLRPVASIVIAIHERWDGLGYPAGLRGTEIPLAARVIAIADAYDVLTSPHLYRDGMLRDEANAEIVRGAGTYYDPDIVRAWLRASDRLECS